MEGWHVILIISLYFGVLVFISQITSKGANNKAFFTAGKESPWFVVAFGMIGVLLSGVTFLSVPGQVATKQFSYLQMVLGNVVGYWFIAGILLPLYYKKNLTSIYEFLGERFGSKTRKTGAFFFLLSKSVGAALRLYLVIIVLQVLVADQYNIPFEVTVIITILLILSYTYKGGIKTVVWTDTLQTAFMIFSLLAFLWWLSGELGGFSKAFSAVNEAGLTQIFNFNLSNNNGFLQSFLAGAFITLVMNGLDQDVMQKNLTCRNIKDAQKNMRWLSLAFLLVNILFMFLGAMLTLYVQKMGVTLKGDELFVGVAKIAPPLLFVIFILGVIAAAYSSADSALTSLTTSFCYDFLDLPNRPQEQQEKIRKIVHINFSIALYLFIIFFRIFTEKNVLELILKAAGFTYGPLLGFFAFGMLTKIKVKDHFLVFVGLVAPILSFVLDYYSKQILNGYQIGFEILLINGAITFGLMFLGKEKEKITS